MSQPDQKQELLLQAALEATKEEREQSDFFREVTDESGLWEVIVRYQGDPASLQISEDTRVETLTGGYGIVWLPREEIPRLSELPQVEYVELPKPIYAELQVGKEASCIPPLQKKPVSFETPENNIESGAEESLYGQGIFLAIIDSGIDYTLPEFLFPDGKTKILRLWDQTLNRVFTEEEINGALEEEDPERRRERIPSVDLSGHGTRVAAIATAIAPASRLLVVKLGVPGLRSFPRTTELMRGVDAVLSFALERNTPVAVNISFGNNYGSHDGTSLLETYLNEMAGVGRNCIVVGSGNEGAEAGHTAGILENPRPGVIPVKEVSWSISSSETSLELQLWKSYADEFDLVLVSPDGEEIPLFGEENFPYRYEKRGVSILAYLGSPTPYSVSQEIFFSFLPTGVYLPEGVWTMRLIPRSIVDGRYDLWLPVASSFNRGTRFLTPVPEVTLTIPSTAAKVITVGAYDARTDRPADFSGRGYLRDLDLIKPDVVAPGVEISLSLGGRLERVTGTSFAAPFVTGSAALMMEWGITGKRDPYLYGEKIKAYLRRGARPVGVLNKKAPNPRTGYGALCVRDSLPLGQRI